MKPSHRCTAFMHDCRHYYSLVVLCDENKKQSICLTSWHNKTLHPTIYKLLSPQHAHSLFELTDKNREFLRPWFPWIDFTVQEKDTEKFIDDQLKLYGEFKAVQVAIEYKQKLVGVVDFHEIDKENEVGLEITDKTRLSMYINGYNFGYDQSPCFPRKSVIKCQT